MKLQESWLRYALATERSIPLIPVNNIGVEKSYQRFCGAMQKAARHSIPRGFRPTYTPCFDEECQDLLKQYQESGDPDIADHFIAPSRHFTFLLARHSLNSDTAHIFVRRVFSNTRWLNRNSVKYPAMDMARYQIFIRHGRMKLYTIISRLRTIADKHHLTKTVWWNQYPAVIARCQEKKSLPFLEAESR